jgi:hypothetical protein
VPLDCLVSTPRPVRRLGSGFGGLIVSCADGGSMIPLSDPRIATLATLTMHPVSQPDPSCKMSNAEHKWVPDLYRKKPPRR